VRLGVEAALVRGELLPGDVELTDGRISAVGLNHRVPGRGVAAPGFVDLQVNGFGGVDFLSADGDGYRRAASALARTGVTAFQPTFITAPEDELEAALHELPAEEGTPRILGAHLEGPFIAADRLGTHPSESRRDPDAALLERLLAAGRVAHVTLAPELPGAIELVDLLRSRGVTVSFGHSSATADEARRGFAHGARTVTHLFNAMRPFEPREPGLAGAALVCPEVLVQVILDGVHLADDTARLVWQAAPGRVALVSDAIAAAGVGDGRYRIGGIPVEVRDGIARRDDGVLAGSTLTMIEAVRNLADLGIPLADAVGAATAVPAQVLGLPELGRLELGAQADLLVLDDNLEIERVCVGGEARVVA
jgi:N-acetylglucosamine-6-phosphate deacetylase